uniref:Uncharacterized protein n=1 Tax=Medicago truncatula TaxID=3880 RepID=A2Q6C1_MEDTR|nr:hypothetical protein MtrDRAFT_AC174467g18v1 [Medicago truncatula]
MCVKNGSHINSSKRSHLTEDHTNQKLQLKRVCCNLETSAAAKEGYGFTIQKLKLSL